MKNLKFQFRNLIVTAFLLVINSVFNLSFGQIKEGQIYFIQARHSSKVLDVKDYSKSDNAIIQQWALHNATNQQFIFKNAGDGTYFIQNVNSGKYLDVTNGSKANGTVIQQYKYHGGSNQRFQVKSAGSGFWYMVNKNSGKNLDVADASNSDGAKLQQWTHTGGQNQQFKLIPIETGKKHVRIRADLTYQRTTDGKGSACNPIGNTEDEIYFKTHAIFLPKNGTKSNVPATWKRSGDPDIWEMGPCSNRTMNTMIFDSRHWLYLGSTGGGWMAPQDQLLLSVVIAEQDNAQLPAILQFSIAAGKVAADVVGLLVGITPPFALNDIASDIKNGTEKLIKSLYDNGHEALGAVEIGLVPNGAGHKINAKALGFATVVSNTTTSATFTLSGCGGSYTLKLTLIE